jgi:hypothetical protein
MSGPRDASSRRRVDVVLLGVSRFKLLWLGLEEEGVLVGSFAYQVFYSM